MLTVKTMEQLGNTRGAVSGGAQRIGIIREPMTQKRAQSAPGAQSRAGRDRSDGNGIPAEVYPCRNVEVKSDSGGTCVPWSSIYRG